MLIFSHLAGDQRGQQLSGNASQHALENVSVLSFQKIRSTLRELTQAWVDVVPVMHILQTHTNAFTLALCNKSDLHIQDAAAENGHPSWVTLAADFLHPLLLKNNQHNLAWFSITTPSLSIAAPQHVELYTLPVTSDLLFASCAGNTQSSEYWRPPEACCGFVITAQPSRAGGQRSTLGARGHIFETLGAIIAPHNAEWHLFVYKGTMWVFY